MVHHIKLDWESHDHPNRFALVEIFPLVWYERVRGSQFDLRPCRKQYFKGEGQRLFLCSLDQRGQDGGFFSLGRIKYYDEMGDRRSGREREGPFLRLTLQFEYPHGSFEYNIGILWHNGGEVVGECNAGAADAEVGNSAIPGR
jgi:hypothetical protein